MEDSSGSCSEAELFIEALSKTPCSEASLMWECSLLEIEFHISVLDYSGAFRRIEDLLIILENSASRSGVPIRIRIRLLNLKARVFIEADRAPKALSLTLKAAVAAYKARLSILMWESIALLAHVMQSLGCHETAIELALMCVEQARDGGSMKVLALLLSALAGSYQALYAMSLRSRSEAAAVHRIEANRWFAEARGCKYILCTGRKPAYRHQHRRCCAMRMHFRGCSPRLCGVKKESHTRRGSKTLQRRL